jgi:hypothetical protein
MTVACRKHRRVKERVMGNFWSTFFMGPWPKQFIGFVPFSSQFHQAPELIA